MTSDEKYILFEGNLRQVLCKNSKVVTIFNEGKPVEIPVSNCEFISLADFFKK